jgi:dihydropteroate synthase
MPPHKPHQNSFPRIMGIVNVTPDSFSDGGIFFSGERAFEHAARLLEDGADILDIGGESSRPGADAVSEQEELRRVIPVIEAVRHVNATVPISVDTTKYAVAEAALQTGATMINDISALRSELRFAELAARHNAALILMHMQGTPRTMQQQPQYTSVVSEVMDFLRAQIALAKAHGVAEIYADVGIGFGKTLDHNLDLLRHHQEFIALGVPLVLGISRKSFLGKLLHIEVAAERDAATLAAHLLLLNAGATIVRVHNVAMLAHARALYEALSPLPIHSEI